MEEREPVRSQVDGDVKDESETKDGHQDEGEDKVRKHIMDESENERLHIWTKPWMATRTLGWVRVYLLI